MRLEDLRHLSGPNVFTAKPVSVARIELDKLTGRQTTDYPGFAARLGAALPGLADHHCAAGHPGGFAEAMARGTYFGHVTEHVALELSSLAGRDVHLGRTMWAGADGRYDVMMECPQDEPAESEVPAELIKIAITAIQDLLSERTPELTPDMARLARVVERERLGVSTAALAAACPADVTPGEPASAIFGGAAIEQVSPGTPARPAAPPAASARWAQTAAEVPALATTAQAPTTTAPARTTTAQAATTTAQAPAMSAQAQGSTVSVQVQGPTGAEIRARCATTAHAEAPLAAGAPSPMSALAAAAEQLVPPLTAAAERVAPPATLGDRATPTAEPLRRADRTTQWNRGHR